MPRDYEDTGYHRPDDVPFTCSPIGDKRPSHKPRGATMRGTISRIIFWILAMCILVNVPALWRLIKL